MIITISREFGSGGRELGKRLADQLGLRYYDKELITEIAEKADTNENYVNYVLEEGGYKNHAYVFARSIPYIAPTPSVITDVLVAQQNVIKKLATEGNCVIVGRSASAILKGYDTFKIFVYADEQSKLERCRKRAPEDEHLTEKQLLKKMKLIDKNRQSLHDLFATDDWDARTGYHLMINTSNAVIKEIVPPLSELIKSYFNRNNK
jgi:cytidylate kinase